MMIWKTAFKDIKSFAESEGKVFAWLIICMICGAFVLNYSYSFARYRGEIYEKNSGISTTKYQISGNINSDDFIKLLDELSNYNLPDVSDYQLFTISSDGYTVVGSSYISKESASFTGLWKEGYAAPIDSANQGACAVSSRLLDYGNRLKMTGEKFVLDGEEFIICGVYEMSMNSDIIIFSDKFMTKYKAFEKLWITFSNQLNDEQENKLEEIIRAFNSDIVFIKPPKTGSVGSDIVKSNELQYSAIMIIFVVCIVSILNYWQEVNVPTYTVYWISGASGLKIMGVALCESLLLCIPTYLIGLGLNALSRLFVISNSLLHSDDILLGFGIYFGVFAIFTLIKTARICKMLSVKNIRRD